MANQNLISLEQDDRIGAAATRLSMDRRERLAKTTPRAVRSQIETMLGNQDRTNTEETE